MIKKLKYHHFFWVLSGVYLILVFISKVIDYNAVLDLNIHDTYYIIDYSHVQTTLFLVFFIIGCVYWSFFKLKISLVNSLCKIHIYVTIGGICVLFLVRFYYQFNTETSDFPLFDKTQNYQLVFMLLIMLIVTSQLIFILNLIISTIKSISQKK